jgi:hypothetical protein
LTLLLHFSHDLSNWSSPSFSDYDKKNDNIVERREVLFKSSNTSRHRMLSPNRYFVRWNQEMRQKFCGGHFFLASS